jgi:N-methylhydantoinase A
VTDANVVLGFLPAALAGGTMRLDVGAARGAIAREIAAPLGLSVEEAALGIREIVNANMARAIRAVTVERGVDPRDFTLLAFGGSGPVHACELARALGIGRVLFPPAPGVFTAMGMLAGSVEHNFLRVMPELLTALDGEAVAAVVRELRAEALAALGREGYASDRVTFEFELDMRFRGQDSEMQIALDEGAPVDVPALREAFLQSYRATYGYASNDEVEVVNLRLRSRGLSERSLDFTALKSDPLAAGVAGLGSRPIWFGGESGWVETPLIVREALAGGRKGPVVLQSPDTTIVVPPDAAVASDVTGNIVVTFPPVRPRHAS